MPSSIPATTIRIEPEVKRQAAAILDELGLSMSTAVNAFLKALIREGGMPFEMRVAPRAADGDRVEPRPERERERVNRRFAPIGAADDGRWS